MVGVHARVSRKAHSPALGTGINLTVFYKCTAAIARKKNSENLKWLPFICALFVLGTANIACSLHFNQLAFIDNAGYQNGPAAFLTEQQSNPANVGAVATSIIMVIFADIFMVMSLLLFFGDYRVEGHPRFIAFIVYGSAR